MFRLLALLAVAKSAPDGYTLLMMSNTHTVNESLIPAKPFQLLRDFAPIAPVNYSDLLLVVHPSVPAKTLKELLDLAKAKPGGLNYASSGPGTPYHMAGELFKAMAGVDIVHVPYKGSSGARTDIVGGQVQMMFDAITTMAPQARAGKVRALAASPHAGAIGCTQRTEILGTPGVQWIGALPREFELATVYSAAVTASTQLPQQAGALLALLGGEQTRELRLGLGFEER